MMQILACGVGLIAVIMGIMALAKGQVKLTPRRTIQGRSARLTGVAVTALGLAIEVFAVLGIPWIMGDPTIFDYIAASSSSRKPENSARFVSKEAGFSINFPKYPRIESTGADPAVARASGTTFIAGVGGLREFGVYYAKRSVKRAVTEEEVDKCRDETVRALTGKLLRESDCSTQGLPGRDCLVDTMDGMVVRFRVFVVDFEDYSVLASVAKGEESSQNVEAFLNSFEITKR